jgi:hypothetical protein
MSKVKLFVLSVLALFAISAAASASASADACEVAGIPSLCIEKTTGVLTAESGTFPFTSVKEAGTISLLVVPELELEIECEIAANTGEFEQTTVLTTPVLAMKVVIEFTKCKVLGPLAAKCKVTEPILTNPIDGVVLDVDTELGHIIFTPEGTPTPPFTAVKLTNIAGCPVTVQGSHNVTGEQLCLLLEPGVDKVDGLLECTAEGSGLLFGEQTATFSLIEEVLLSGAEVGHAWSIVLA